MNYEYEVKISWLLPDRHVHLKNISYTKYNWLDAYSFWEIKQNTKTTLTTEPGIWGQGQMTPVGQVHLTIIPYIKYGRPIAYNFRDMDLTL
jgi:hypothetical protein